MKKLLMLWAIGVIAGCTTTSEHYPIGSRDANPLDIRNIRQCTERHRMVNVNGKYIMQPVQDCKL